MSSELQSLKVQSRASAACALETEVQTPLFEAFSICLDLSEEKKTHSAFLQRDWFRGCWETQQTSSVFVQFWPFPAIIDIFRHFVQREELVQGTLERKLTKHGFYENHALNMGDFT